MALSRILVVGLFSVSIFAAGCVGVPTSSFCGLPGFDSGKRADAVPTGPVTQLLVTWRNEVMCAPDVVHQGRPLPGLAGRLFLLSGDNGFPVRGDGDVLVDLYDVSNLPPGENPLLAAAQGEKSKKLLERWRFDAESLKTLLQKDMVGFGYTLFLPWGSYRPDIRQVALVVCYQTKNATPIYSSTALVTLNADSSPVVEKQQLAPGARGAARTSGVLGAPVAGADPGRLPQAASSAIAPTRIPLPTSQTTVFGRLAPNAPQ